MRHVLVMPIGDVDRGTIQSITGRVREIFECETMTGDIVPLPPNTYNARRRQYNSTRILKALETRKPLKFDGLLGVIDQDLYVPELNFVFGEADVLARIAVIGLPRLRPEFYGFEPDLMLFMERAGKEAVHELGHLESLGHCPDPRCVMHFSNSLGDTDIKEAKFCSRCKSLLNKLE